MLLRFAAENIMSFKDAVEFNTFPSSKSHSHEWHKVQCDYATVLRMSAIYGANGAGKSNLLRCIDLLKELVSSEKITNVYVPNELPFKFGDNEEVKPSELAIEFFANGQIFYYHIIFTRREILDEELLLCGKTKDTPIYKRKGQDVTLSLSNVPKAEEGAFMKVFTDVMSRIIRPDILVLSFFGMYYPEEFPVIKDAYDWIRNLQVVLPAKRYGFLPHLLSEDSSFLQYVNDILGELNMGISKLTIKKEVVDEADVANNWGLKQAIEAAKARPNEPQMYKRTIFNEISNIVFRDNTIYMESIVATHVNSKGDSIITDIDMESDGTRRLIEYMPLLHSILKENGVYIVDEIERSIHPIMIKSIMRKISESKEAKGQIIFTTHESCLLDQSIFRPDEIWFAQKDVNQSTQLYPLSDYNIHKTANIENGYLNGRYGGIPFLSNLTDLKW